MTHAVQLIILAVTKVGEKSLVLHTLSAEWGRRSFIVSVSRSSGMALFLPLNILDAEVLKDAQAHPKDYRHLLVRITGYNAYFVSIGKELQDEIIARESHKGY